MIAPSEVDRDATTAEVRAAFTRYEAALVAGDAGVLDELFWESASTVRFGVADRQEGSEAIARWRRSQGPLPGRRLDQTRVSVFGEDAAVVTTLFRYPDRNAEGRQSQTWIRMTDGWRIVSAHVSETPLGDG